ncbi:Galactokinase [Croceitalea dokdonensis DOKDO 023]|uniref:Galactokinase n=1 Tax=Croceitalea dokdonensis DOKDO 023 TaxID=1300341 RepID=A0A0P7A4Z3_9FLAO|nr:galactokinase family protein [Croceitalea dokdonensis]KPM31515.1 Galactokinase [Croceitalea dokdonensis DOKDO 023]
MENIVIKSLDRINLLGEHVDHNDGLVLPAAIDKCIYMTLKTNGSEDTHFNPAGVVYYVRPFQ